MEEHKKLNSKSKVDLVRVPPCQSRNPPVALYKRADESILEKPKTYVDGEVWTRTNDGVLEPM